ncbi:proline-specific peptidase [Melanogaster broomeanus]|nr:proline-specific peptidase [Melanogaster broomeanus]
MLETTGTLDFQVGNETYQTWYKVVGDLKSGIRPLVTLHGGPGMSHVYMISHTEIYTTHGIPVVFYDQLGIGASTHLPAKPAEFWTVALFMDELDNLLAKLGIAGDFDLLGHSWGGMLAADYASTRHPRGLRRLHEREGTTASQEYQDGLQVFYNKHTCQVIPWPEELVASFKTMEDDPTVYTTMLGTSEFNSTGTLKTWSTIDRLHTITCPTLVANGAEEGAQDFVVAPFIERIPKVESHCPFWEDKEYYFQTLGEFLLA